MQTQIKNSKFVNDVFKLYNSADFLSDYEKHSLEYKRELMRMDMDREFARD